METPKSTKNRDTWNDEATIKFIAIWREKQSDIKKIGPKKQLFQDWSNRLSEEGINKTAGQVQKKLENMKQLYKKYKPNCTGGTPPSWKYWKDVHEILQTSHYYNEEMATTLDSMETESNETSNQSDISLSDDVLSNLKKGSKKRKSVSEVVENQTSKFEQFLEDAKKRHEERMEELKEGRNSIQKRVEEIGDRAIKVLDLIEKKLNLSQNPV